MIPSTEQLSVNECTGKNELFNIKILNTIRAFSVAVGRFFKKLYLNF